MKKFFIVLLCLIITIPALAIKPPKEYVEKWRKEYKDNLAKCPADKPIYTGYGECRSCNEIDSFTIPPFIGDFCSQICPNRKTALKVIPGSDIFATYCVLKDAPGPDFHFDEHSKSWVKPNCPDDKPLYFEGKCIACNEYKNWDNVKNVLGCEKCSNKIMEGNNCYLNNCPDDKPLIHYQGSCYPCSAKSITIISGHDKCTELHPSVVVFKNTTRKQ
ncbi:MAG: hypothetical protein J5594_06090 [Elusimicrobiaceae bacterium]|nr:hypothetical protein [Elusimicrobiaceae bacterium]